MDNSATYLHSLRSLFGKDDPENSVNSQKFKMKIEVDSSVILPFRKVKGFVVIETSEEVLHQGFHIQFEGLYAADARYLAETGRALNDNRTRNRGEWFRRIHGFAKNSSPKPPARFVFAEEITDPDADNDHSIKPGTWKYPFFLNIPGNVNLPAPFLLSGVGCLLYRLVVGMKLPSAKSGGYLDVSELLVNFKGHFLRSEESSLLVQMKESYRESVISRSLVKTQLSVGKSEFLPGESIPFSLNVENRKMLPLRTSVKLVQCFWYEERNAAGAATIKSKFGVASETERESCQAKLYWTGSVGTGESLAPSTDPNLRVHGVSYNLKVEVEIPNHGSILISTPIYMGTTRDSERKLRKIAKKFDADLAGISLNRPKSMATVASSEFSSPQAKPRHILAVFPKDYRNNYSSLAHSSSPKKPKPLFP